MFTMAKNAPHSEGAPVTRSAKDKDKEKGSQVAAAKLDRFFHPPKSTTHSPGKGGASSAAAHPKGSLGLSSDRRSLGSAVASKSPNPVNSTGPKTQANKGSGGETNKTGVTSAEFSRIN